MMSRFASAAADTAAWPLYVYPCRKTPAPSDQNGSAIEGATSTAPIGRYPLVMPFAHVSRSGSRFHRDDANQSPHRANPVMTSSATNRTPASRQIARVFSRYPGGGAYTPPAPITGSQKNAATRSEPIDAIVSESASASSHATWATSSSSSPQPAVFAGIPESDVPPACMPW